MVNKDYVSSCLSTYWNTIYALGYKSYKEVYKLLFVIFLEELLSDPIVRCNITKEDYSVINSALEKVYGTSCLTPYNSDYKTGFSSFNTNLSVNRIKAQGVCKEPGRKTPVTEFE